MRTIVTPVLCPIALFGLGRCQNPRPAGESVGPEPEIQDLIEYYHERLVVPNSVSAVADNSASFCPNRFLAVNSETALGEPSASLLARGEAAGERRKLLSQAVALKVAAYFGGLRSDERDVIQDTALRNIKEERATGSAIRQHR